VHFLRKILPVDASCIALMSSSRGLRASASDREDTKSLLEEPPPRLFRFRWSRASVMTIRQLRSLKIRAWTATLSLPPFAGGFHGEASVRRPVGVSPWPRFVLRARVSCISPRSEPREVSFWRRNGVLAAEPSSGSSFLALLQLEMSRARTRSTAFLARRRA